MNDPNNSDWEYSYKYTLHDDLVRIVDLTCKAPFENEWLKLEPIGSTQTRITVKAGYSWDGCSVVPDAPRSKDASAIHDDLYQFAKVLAAAWGCSVNDVLFWSNHAFLQVMRQDKCPVAGLYFAGVQVFGPLYHTIASWF